MHATVSWFSKFLKLMQSAMCVPACIHTHMWFFNSKYSGVVYTQRSFTMSILTI